MNQASRVMTSMYELIRQNNTDIERIRGTVKQEMRMNYKIRQTKQMYERKNNRIGLNTDHSGKRR